MKIIEKTQTDKSSSSWLFRTGTILLANMDYTGLMDYAMVIEVPERGKAIQYGRFNQGGDTNIFPEALPVAA